MRAKYILCARCARIMFILQTTSAISIHFMERISGILSANGPRTLKGTSIFCIEELANYNIGLDEVEATLRWINEVPTVQVRSPKSKSGR